MKPPASPVPPPAATAAPLTAASPSALLGKVAAEDANMADEPNEGRRRSGWWVWLALLSAGPAVFIVEKTGTGEQVVEVV